MTTKTSEKERSGLFSFASLALIIALTVSIIQWNHENDAESSRHSTTLFTTTTHHSRTLQSSLSLLQADEDPITDDATRDDVCREYIKNFLNGTTDARDECDGMLHAYQAADCGDDDNAAGGVKLTRRHRHSDGNITDDDVIIDDFYENWECCSSIYEYYTIHCHEPKLESFQLLGVVAVLVACGFVKSLIKTFRLEWIPEAGACIVVGAIVGASLKIDQSQLD
jgi:hypothetical protein